MVFTSQTDLPGLDKLLPNIEAVESSILPAEIEVALITGGFDRPYAFGLAMALISENVLLDVIGSDEVDSSEMHITPNLTFLNLQGGARNKNGFTNKLFRLVIFYVRLVRYAATARPKIFHILWNNKIALLDRTLLMIYYKLLGKKIAFTAHNVNAGRRDGNDSVLNRASLKIQYSLADHIFVHTEKMKSELLEEHVNCRKAVTVIPFGINNAVPRTQLTPAEAKQRLGIGRGERTILFFGAIRPYKGVEYLVAAFQRVAKKNENYRLIIAGEPKKESKPYLRQIQETIAMCPSREKVIQKIEFVPDSETELYFKAADVLVLPYAEVFQSGVLVLAYSFGLPVIASDVGSFRDDIVPGKTGYICRSCEPIDLAKTIEEYFQSELFENLPTRRQEIQEFANQRYSWKAVGRVTRDVYAALLNREPS
jgi:glycosyltransferase involved in cell wall biosynthesis